MSTEVQPGDTMLVFDALLWARRGDNGDDSQFWKPATLLRVYSYPGDDDLADVRFHHNGRESVGHYTFGMRPIQGE